jgi:hypothetical protein
MDLAEHPEIAEVEWIDDCFRVYKRRSGLYSTVTKENRELLTGLDQESTIRMTRWYLKCEQDGSLEENSRIVGDATVGGKL